jgi:hypothetical protein
LRETSRLKGAGFPSRINKGIYCAAHNKGLGPLAVLSVQLKTINALLASEVITPLRLAKR